MGEFFKEYLGREGREGSILQNRCRSQSPCLGAFNHSLARDFVGWIQKSLKGLMGERGRRRERKGVRSNSERGKRITLTTVKGYLYPKNPDTPG
jgi:hypothetical protein